MTQQQLTTDVYTHVAIISSGSVYYLTEQKYQQYKLANKGDIIQLPDGSSFNVSHIVDVPTVDNYEKQHPKKEQPNMQQPPNKPLESFEDIVEEFQPLANKFMFGNLLPLVVKTHKAMTEWQGDFKSFCVKHKAMTATGAICAGKYRDSKGYNRTAVFAYPFFVAVKKLIDTRKARHEYAEAKSWDDLLGAKEAIGQV